ncbi:MAG: hypothetical protein C0P75_004590 [Bacilli bacterium]|uniref:hypothetical protein n=1 Tax=Ureibacillus sp. FSL K6-3587 TaxID=2954681 RepID=UPI001ED3882C|nr:hypothetical protein [Bacilli bacterium]
MRTSRVQSVVNSTYTKRYLHSSHDQVFKMMNDGGGRHFFSKNPREQQKNKRNNTEQNRSSNAILNRNTKRMVIIGQPLDSETVEKMRNRLMQHQMNIQKARNKEALIRTYRKSI